MSKLDIQSGCVQSVTPSQRIESYQANSEGGEAVLENLQIAKPDPTGPFVGAGRYDGSTAFGLFIVDQSLDGETTP